MEIITESKYRLVIPRHGQMRVPGVVFATRALIPDPLGPGMRRPARDDDEAVHQAAHCLGDAFFPGRPHASIRRSAGRRALRCPRSAPSFGPAIASHLPVMS